jgi:hypothetical protein
MKTREFRTRRKIQATSSGMTNIYPHCKNFKSQLNSQVTRIVTEKTFADSQPELKEKTTTHPLPNT